MLCWTISNQLYHCLPNWNNWYFFPGTCRKGKTKSRALTCAAQLVGLPPTKGRAAGWMPGQGTGLGCRFCPIWHIQETTHQCFSPSLSPSLPLSLKIINKIFKNWFLKKVESDYSNHNQELVFHFDILYLVIQTWRKCSWNQIAALKESLEKSFPLTINNSHCLLINFYIFSSQLQILCVDIIPFLLLSWLFSSCALLELLQ